MQTAHSSLNIVGKRVCQLRKAKGLTQAILIAHCQLRGWQVSRETLAKIESGVRRVNDAEVALLVQVLGCAMDDLLTTTPDEALRVARHSPDSD